MYVKLTEEQAKLVPGKEKGYTTEKINGVKNNVTFCSNLSFIKYVGVELEKTFITI